MLRVDDVHVSYGKVAALRGLSLRVEEGGFSAIIGSNGAGKSSALRAISGLVPIRGGEIHFGDQRLDGLSADRIVRLGVAHVPEGRRVFKDLSVRENLELGAYTRRDRAGINTDLEWVYQHLPRLKERGGQQAGTMSGGEQQMLAIGRALMARPRLLLLDEPSLGLAPLIVQGIARLLREIQGRGISILLVEQNAELALELVRYGYVLETGSLRMQGTAVELMGNEHVRKAYLGI